MAKRSEPVQLYLMTPPLADAGSLTPALKEVMAAAPIACVLVTLAPTDDNSAKRLVQALAPIVQGKGAALLLNGWSAIVARAGADGIHIAQSRNQLREALGAHKPDRIVGAAGIRSRDDAMTVGDMVVAGHSVDYLMFGEPQGDGRTPPLADIVERTQWWSELFEIPCVAYAPDLAAVPLLADAGADFIALGRAVWDHADGPAAAVSLASRLLSQRSLPA